jgi:hypothetical protein
VAATNSANFPTSLIDSPFERGCFLPRLAHPFHCILP